MDALEIFTVDNGTITWLQSAPSVQAAKAEMKLAASKHGEYIVSSNPRGQRKRIFLVGYDPKLLEARAELLTRFGHDVWSALGNEAAFTALGNIQSIDLFVVGHTAPERTRREMVTWLRVHFSNAKIVSLNPGKQSIRNADFNITWGKHDWILLAAAAVA
jgi:PleD family two-component response regulator